MTLYLLPTPIAEEALHTLPAYALETIGTLDFFIAERAKTARHFLKAANPGRPIQEIEVVEIDERDPTFACNAFREAMAKGKNVGLLSEAGCPGVADPGADIVSLAHQMGVQVRPLVGPSSILLALMASGMNGQSFTFHGYLSPKRPELAKDLRRLEQEARRKRQTQIFIETPYRSQMVLEVALENLQPETMFGVTQDLTGATEMIRSLTVSAWKKAPKIELARQPAVFMVY